GGDRAEAHVAAGHGDNQVAGGDVAGGERSQSHEANIAGSADVADRDRGCRGNSHREIVGVEIRHDDVAEHNCAVGIAVDTRSDIDVAARDIAADVELE